MIAVAVGAMRGMREEIAAAPGYAALLLMLPLATRRLFAPMDLAKAASPSASVTARAIP